MFRRSPVLFLLAFNALVALFAFRNYGLSWDEPLFYDYADALRYAYSPREWFSPDFDLNRAFGSSGSDHANRGPAYIILARPFVALAEALDADHASAWHLVNFLTFQLGVYLLYRFARRYVSEPAALASAALFAWQPLLWGHAFINPKDIPFMVFFTGAVLFGFEMIDQLADTSHRVAEPQRIKTPRLRASAAANSILLASFFLGIATSIRVLGPLAAILVGVYALTKLKKDSLWDLVKTFAIYGVIALLVALATWPYLWLNPLQKFIEVFGFMSANPTHLPVLFGGQIYPADQLPRRYLPVLLAYTLTEPVLPLFFIGLLIAFLRKKLITEYWTLLPVFLWFLIPFAYVILRQPPMYDGYRHFLFILPPIFIFAGFAFEKIGDVILSRNAAKNLQLIIALLFLIPSIYGVVQLHPYEYAYYNSFIGGVSGAFRKYETEYWLTCYKAAVENFEEQNVNLFVKREAYIAAYYADDINVRDYRAELGEIQSGDYALVNTRTNEDIKFFRDAPVVLQVGRAGAIFCEVKHIP